MLRSIQFNPCFSNTKINIIPQILRKYVPMYVTNKHNIVRMSTYRKQTSLLFTKHENKWDEVIRRKLENPKNIVLNDDIICN